MAITGRCRVLSYCAGFGSDPDVTALRPLSYARAPVYAGSLCQIAHPDRRHSDVLHRGGFLSARQAAAYFQKPRTPVTLPPLIRLDL
jgi:hypothetical protein